MSTSTGTTHMSEDTHDENPLQFYTKEELWEELKNRYSAALFVGDLYDRPVTGSNSQSVWWDGSIPQALGLARFAENELLKESQERDERGRGIDEDE